MKTKLLFLMLFAALSFGYGQVTSVSITGEAAGGWPGSAGDPGPVDVHQMASTDGVNWTFSGLIVTNAASGGGVKFRANNDWAINWGSTAFPTGTGTQGGANILCIGGTYDVTFNSTTGEYNFSGGAPIPVVKLTGTAVADGIVMTTTDAITYSLSNVTLLDGLAQFNIDGTQFGGDTFPTGTVVDNTLNIPVVAGVYSSVTVDISSGAYSFVAAPIYPLISITGIGVGGWGDGFDFDMTTTDGITYTYNALAINGTPGSNEIKFRTNHNWTDPNYGDTGWPSGVATTAGGNIPCAASGTYDVTFNLTTGAYTFSIPGIAIVGAGTTAGWPTGAVGEVDALQMTTTDGANYSISNIVLGATDPNNVVKFRTNNDWSQPNYGGVDFPAGPGTDANGNIVVTTAGTYNVAFNRVTKAYLFTDALATTTFNSANFKVYPNPTSNVWNFTSLKQTIESIQIVDVLGKTIMTISPKDISATVDGSSLTRGLYFAKIATVNATETVKLVKN